LAFGITCLRYILRYHSMASILVSAVTAFDLIYAFYTSFSLTRLLSCRGAPPAPRVAGKKKLQPPGFGLSQVLYIIQKLRSSSKAVMSSSCQFCEIAKEFAAFNATTPPAYLDDGQERSAHIVVSTRDVIAFLDIMPLSRGHVLVCPRRHVEKMTELSPADNAQIAAWLPVIARAACKVSGYQDFNVIQNNGMPPWCVCARVSRERKKKKKAKWQQIAKSLTPPRWVGVFAAQVIPHVHYHIVPRPNERQREKLEEDIPSNKRLWWKGRFNSGWRTFLEDDVGTALAAEMRAEVYQEVRSIHDDPKMKNDMRCLASL
jgi:diadenosine tetraphosphate (Ap4A) HIT family hydrolase